MRRRAVVAVAGLVASLTLAGCSADDTADRELLIATGNSTGVYSVLGRGYANLVAAQLPGYSMSPEVTGGSKQNIEQLVSGEADVGFASLSWASDAITGQGEYRTPQPIRALARLYLNYVQVVVRSDVRDLAGLRDRTISTGSPGSTGELAAARLLALAGLEVNRDTHRQKVSLDDSVREMKAGRLDAIFWSGGLPTAGIQDLLRTLGSGARVLDLGAYFPRMSILYPDVYEAAVIAPAGYGLPRPVRTIAEPNLLLVNDAMDRDLADRLTGTLLGNLPQLAGVHPEGRNISRARAEQTDPVPLHSGALRWYRDNS